MSVARLRGHQLARRGGHTGDGRLGALPGGDVGAAARARRTRPSWSASRSASPSSSGCASSRHTRARGRAEHAARDGEPIHRLLTPRGALTARKLAFATNAYSHLFEQLGRLQVPAFTYMIATEPLTEEQLAPIGWHGGQGIEDARNLIHYYRLTPDKRIVLGGGPVGLTTGGEPRRRRDERAWRHLEQYLHWLWPHLSGRRDRAPLGRPVLGHARPHPCARVRRRATEAPCTRSAASVTASR